MYHFPEHLYHNNAYQQNAFAGPTTTQLVGVTKSTDKLIDQYEPALSIHVKTTDIKRTPRESADPVVTKREKNNKKQKKKPNDKSSVDTSNYSVEERLVAAVWVHERKRTRISLAQIRQDFRHRFGRKPPTKTTLTVWEQKLFSTGSVCDAPRSGRPASSQCLAEEGADCNPPPSTPRRVPRAGGGGARGIHQSKPKLKKKLTKSSPPAAGTPFPPVHPVQALHTDGYT